LSVFSLWDLAVHRLDADFASSGSGNLGAIDFVRRTARIRRSMVIPWAIV